MKNIYGKIENYDKYKSKNGVFIGAQYLLTQS